MLRRDKWRDYVTQVRQGIEQTVKAMPDHKTLLGVLRGELAGPPAATPAAPPKLSPYGAPLPRATVALPGQAAPMKPTIVMKKGRG